VKRLHVHVAVESLEESIEFYSVLFGGQPTIQKADYAKWMLDDPRVNFAISARGRAPGVDHLGIQVEAREELAEVAGRLRRAIGEGVGARPVRGFLGDLSHDRRKGDLR